MGNCLNTRIDALLRLPTSRQWPPRPPKMQWGRMSVVDRLFCRRGAREDQGPGGCGSGEGRIAPRGLCRLLLQACSRGGGRRQASASRGSVGEFLLWSFYVIDLLELNSGICCREAVTSSVRDQMSREDADGPFGRAGKAEEGQAA